MKRPRFLIPAPDHGPPVTLLTRNNALDCLSWSLPAGPPVCAGFTLESPRSICRSCYAGQGRYSFPVVKRAQAARWAWWQETPAYTKIEVLSKEIAKQGGEFFRVFDSGDFSTPDDVWTWVEVIKGAPGTRFWVSTRVWHQPAFREGLLELVRNSDTVVRRSGLEVGNLPPPDPDLPWTTSSWEATEEFHGCPKQTHGSCTEGGCRSCWDPKVGHVAFAMHGHRVDWKKLNFRLTPVENRGNLAPMR